MIHTDHIDQVVRVRVVRLPGNYVTRPTGTCRTATFYISHSAFLQFCFSLLGPGAHFTRPPVFYDQVCSALAARHLRNLSIKAQLGASLVASRPADQKLACLGVLSMTINCTPSKQVDKELGHFLTNKLHFQTLTHGIALGPSAT